MTILVDRGGCRGELDAYISRLESLLAHLKNLRAGILPTAEELAAAPVLERWRPTVREAECLVGNVDGHPSLGGLMTTSEVWTYAPALGWSRTMSRLFRLGRPAGHSDRHWN